MEPTVTFHTPAGQAVVFEKTDPQTSWELETGVVLFATSDAYGYRIIRIMELIGRQHDVRLLWALTEAERYGANQIFIARESDPQKRSDMIESLEYALNPIIRRTQIGRTFSEPRLAA